MSPHKTTRLIDQVTLELQLFMVCHHLAKFCDHRYCINRGMFLDCHTIKQDHMTNVSREYNDKRPSW